MTEVHGSCLRGEVKYTVLGSIVRTKDEYRGGSAIAGERVANPNR
jgi:hypothetical protein